MDSTLFSRPREQAPIQDQSAGQQATGSVRKALVGPASQASKIDYDAYKLAQQARGLPILPLQQWQIVFRNQQLTNR